MAFTALDAQAHSNLGCTALHKILAESFGFQKHRIGEILIALKDLRTDPHMHTGFGLRQLHGTHFYETRLDLRWRLIFKMSEEEIVFFDVMNHDQVRRL